MSRQNEVIDIHNFACFSYRCQFTGMDNQHKKVCRCEDSESKCATLIHLHTTDHASPCATRALCDLIRCAQPWRWCGNDMAVLPELFFAPCSSQNGGTAVMGLGTRLCTHLNQSMLQERCVTQLTPWSIDHWVLQGLTHKP